MDSIRLDIIVAPTYRYLEREIWRVLKFHMENSSYFEITFSHF